MAGDSFDYLKGSGGGVGYWLAFSGQRPGLMVTSYNAQDNALKQKKYPAQYLNKAEIEKLWKKSEEAEKGLAKKNERDRIHQNVKGY